jgi:chemotaxis regulatin CheY-phosphate phosphatase CheZ
MAKKKMLGAHVKKLLTGVSDHGIAHLVEVETDLFQTTILLAEAIEKLSSNFLTLHASILLQEEQIKMLVDSNQIPKGNLSRLSDIQSNIETQLNDAVKNLQFQDLTNQLISRTVQRSVGLRELLSILEIIGKSIPHEGAEDEIGELLVNIVGKLEVQSAELKQVLRKTVDQKNLVSGDIELF